MSLRDQLLKAGMVTKQQAKKAETEQRKRRHQAKKHGTIDPEEACRQQQLTQEAAAKKRRDRMLNEQRQAEKARMEKLATIRHMIAQHGEQKPDAEIDYYVKMDTKRLRRIRVTEQQRRWLALGKLAVVTPDDDSENLAIVSRTIGEKIAGLSSHHLITLYSESKTIDDSTDDDR